MFTEQTAIVIGPTPASVPGHAGTITADGAGVGLTGIVAADEHKAVGRVRSPIAAGRASIPVLILPDPEIIPSSQEIRVALPDDLLEACRVQLQGPRSKARTIEALLRAHLPVAGPRPRNRIDFMVDTGQPADPATHDEFFRIRRTSGHAPAVFIRGIFRALDILRDDLEQAPTSLAGPRLERLAAALAGTLQMAMGGKATAPAFAWKTAQCPLTENYSVKRWIRGHQLFGTLSQGLIFALNTLGEADRIDDDGRMREAADLTAALLEASACALELTGDFPEATYRQSIRKSMESPFLPNGFSGLLSNDHRQLVMVMKTQRPAIENLRARHPDSHALIFEKLNEVYASHKHVCARFVGPEQTSLLMAQTSGRSAVEQIERFRQMRLRSWGPCHGSEA